MLADAHCHLQFSAFDADRPAVIRRARQQGVSRLVVAGTRLDEIGALTALSRPGEVDICFGLHPWFLDDHGDDDIEQLAQALASHEVVALGECGVDARIDSPERQWRLFDAQLKLAKRLALPVVIHCVKYEDEVGKRLGQLALPAGGLIHAFTGSLQQAERLIGLGFTLGIGGAVTHDRAHKLKRTVAALPEGSFVLETDAPDMTPQGAAGERNEPANVTLVAAEVARLRGISAETLAAQTGATLERLLRR
ncbi:TatD family hydrolase [Kushneria aurantia]|uniref:TatD family hydrolase n=1 Tax=Kushneria aurantia TaxID=504092 RepID=A0ABV6G4L5_9GAMM|nr:TatD family hydrolase [Kushneria aurantia]